MWSEMENNRGKLRIIVNMRAYIRKHGK